MITHTGAPHAFAEVLPLGLRAIPNRRSRARLRRGFKDVSRGEPFS